MRSVNVVRAIHPSHGGGAHNLTERDEAKSQLGSESQLGRGSAGDGEPAGLLLLLLYYTQA